MQVTPGFQQAESDILERADTLRESLTKQGALLDQLEEQVGNLEQVVEDFTSGLILAVRVFEMEAAVFLDIEAFVFDTSTGSVQAFQRSRPP